MKWWRSLSFIHESRFIGLFSLLWSAKTPHKICDTNFLMTCVYKLTMFLTVVPFQLELCEIWWLLRYFKTSFSCSGGGGIPLYLLMLSILSKYYNWMWNFGKAHFVQYPVIKWKSSCWNWEKHETFPFWKSSDRSITNMQIFAKS